MRLRRAPAPVTSLRLAAALVVGVALQSACKDTDPPPTSEPPPQSIAVVHAPPVRADDDKKAAHKGTGWYPNLEVDGDNRLHVAWVDADVGDVLYTVSAKGGAALEGKPVAVDVDGAVGSFLRLALGPGGVPVFSYVRQDESTLRLAWRPADRARVKDAGGDVELGAMPELPRASRTGSPLQGAAGFVVEEVGFGDQVGRGSALSVDDKGRPLLAYYAADDRLRLARRPADVPAFSPTSIGVLEKRDLDPAAAASIRVQSDLLITKDGTVVVSYCHDVVTDARLRIAVLPKGAERAILLTPGEGDDQPSITVDGLTSGLHLRDDGAIDVTSLDKSERAVFVRTLELGPDAQHVTPVWRGPREKLFDVDGNAVTERRRLGALGVGGWYAVARVRNDRKGEGGGVFLYVVDELTKDAKVSRTVRRIRLDGGDQDDAWLDLVVRPDGRPAAVWFDGTSSSLKLYAP